MQDQAVVYLSSVTLLLCLALLPRFTLFVLSHPSSTFCIFLEKNLGAAAEANEADKGKHQQAGAAEPLLP